MKFTLPMLVGLCLVMLACDSAKEKTPEEQQMMAVQDESAVRNMLTNLHADLQRVYGGSVGEVDSLYALYFVPDMYYVTPWGTSETLDSTIARLKTSIPHISNYENSIENLFVSIHGEGGYGRYVLRQTYVVDGFEVEDYLPTTVAVERVNGQWKIVHLQRSTDMKGFQQLMNLQEYLAKQSRQKR